MVAQEDPEFTSSHEHIQSTPTYREIYFEDLKAEWTATAHRRTTQKWVVKMETWYP